MAKTTKSKSKRPASKKVASAGNATEKLVDVVVGDVEETEETSDDDEVVSVADE